MMARACVRTLRTLSHLVCTHVRNLHFWKWSQWSEPRAAAWSINHSGLFLNSAGAMTNPCVASNIRQEAVLHAASTENKAAATLDRARPVLPRCWTFPLAEVRRLRWPTALSKTGRKMLVSLTHLNPISSSTAVRKKANGIPRVKKRNKMLFTTKHSNCYTYSRYGIQRVIISNRRYRHEPFSATMPSLLI